MDQSMGKGGKVLGFWSWSLGLLWFGFKQKSAGPTALTPAQKIPGFVGFRLEKILNGIKEQRKENLHNLKSPSPGVEFPPGKGEGQSRECQEATLTLILKS